MRMRGRGAAAGRFPTRRRPSTETDTVPESGTVLTTGTVPISDPPVVGPAGIFGSGGGSMGGFRKSDGFFESAVMVRRNLLISRHRYGGFTILAHLQILSC